MRRGNTEDAGFLDKRKKQTYYYSFVPSCRNFSSLPSRKMCSLSCNCLFTSPVLPQLWSYTHIQQAVKSVGNWNSPTEQATKCCHSLNCGKCYCLQRLSGRVSNCHSHFFNFSHQKVPWLLWVGMGAFLRRDSQCRPQKFEQKSSQQRGCSDMKHGTPFLFCITLLIKCLDKGENKGK